MKSIMMLAAGLLIAVMTMAALLWNGTFNFAADEPHWPVTHDLINFARERSIATRRDGLQAPDLTDAALVSSGAGNYDAMCTGCHLKPGLDTSELSAALYPKPIDLTSTRESEPRRDFLIIKHGIKMSGMPAWGKSMGDEYIWGMVAFLQTLPEQTPGSSPHYS
jgi:mono/diheme cytochrome c family protein